MDGGTRPATDAGRPRSPRKEDQEAIVLEKTLRYLGVIVSSSTARTTPSRLAMASASLEVTLPQVLHPLPLPAPLDRHGSENGYNLAPGDKKEGLAFPQVLL